MIQLMAESLDGNHFQALRYQAHVEAWRVLFNMMHELGLQDTELTKPQRRVLGILKTGLRLSFGRSMRCSQTVGRRPGRSTGWLSACWNRRWASQRRGRFWSQARRPRSSPFPEP